MWREFLVSFLFSPTECTLASAVLSHGKERVRVGETATAASGAKTGRRCRSRSFVASVVSLPTGLWCFTMDGWMDVVAVAGGGTERARVALHQTQQGRDTRPIHKRSITVNIVVWSLLFPRSCTLDIIIDTIIYSPCVISLHRRLGRSRALAGRTNK